VVVSGTEFRMMDPVQHGKETFFHDVHLSLYLARSVLPKDNYCYLISQFTMEGGTPETVEKRWCARPVGFHGRELTDVFQSTPLLSESRQLPVVKTGNSIQLLAHLKSHCDEYFYLLLQLPRK